jgi:hypothetical protein
MIRLVPIAAGEYGVLANHAPHAAQLKAGILQILHEETEYEYIPVLRVDLTKPSNVAAKLPSLGWGNINHHLL